MKTHKLKEMKTGWFVGDFTPTALRSADVEVSCKRYAAGAYEARHVHKIAVEVTLIASGRARMNGAQFEAGDIVVIEPGEATDFEAINDCMTVVVKTPSVPGDKYLLDEQRIEA